MSEQLSDLLNADGERAGQILVERLIATMSAQDPHLPELFKAAALPRAFDKATLAALTQEDGSSAEFTSAFSGLIAFPFVYGPTAGTYSLHDSVRSVLLRQWRDRADYPEHLQRLLAYYDECYQKARNTAAALASVTETMRRINVDRWSAAAEHTEDLLIRPVIEALHVALMIGIGEGWQRMTSAFTDFENQARYRLCGMLVTVFAEHADNVPDEARAAHNGWAAYFAARLADDRQRWEEAEEHLEKVKQPEKIDNRLASWVYSEKAANLAGQCRYDEALAMHDRNIALEEENQIDPWNTSVSWSAKAQIYRLLWDQTREAAALQEAMRSASEAGNTYNLVVSKCLMVDALSAVGDTDAAVTTLLEAMRTTRQILNLDVSASLQVAATALSCLGPRSARLLYAIAAQYRQLAQSRWPTSQLDLLLDQAEALARGGDAPAAVTFFEQAHQFAVEHQPERVRDADSYRASWATTLGEAARGAEVTRKLLQDPAQDTNKWQIASLLTNVAESLSAMGGFCEALEWLRQARQMWKSIHHDRAVSLTWSYEADILRKLGKLDEARSALAKTTDTAARGYEFVRYECAARLALAAADYAEAASLARKAVEIQAHTDRKRKVTVGLLAVEALSEAGRFGEAAEISTRVQRLLDELEAFCEWKPGDRAHLADEHAARAVRIMIVGRGSDGARLHAAREHLQIATQLDPDLGWFHLELAFVDLGQHRQRQAIRRLGDAARLTEDAALSNAILQLRAELESQTSGSQ